MRCAHARVAGCAHWMLCPQPRSKEEAESMEEQKRCAESPGLPSVCVLGGGSAGMRPLCNARGRAMEEQRQTILSSIMTPEARERCA